MKRFVSTILGFILIVVGIYLIRDYVVPFFKAISGIILIMIGISLFFTRSAGHVRYKVR